MITNSAKNIKLEINKPITSEKNSIGVMVFPSDLDNETNSSEKIKCCFFNMKEDVGFMRKNREKKINIYKCKYCSCFRIQKKTTGIQIWERNSIFLCDLFCKLKVFGKEFYKCNFIFNYNYIYFMISMVIGLGFHYLDIYSDINVLIDLFNNDIIHFYVCLGIMILSSIFSFISHQFIASGEKTEGIERGACKNIGVLSFIMGFLQLGILNETYHSIRIEKKTRGYVYSRIFESMIESLPQSLFQLYIFLKNIDSFSNDQLYIYSFSILISILSVSFSIISYEIFNCNFRNSSVSVKLFSIYGFLLIIYRLSEVIARMGLLALFSISIGTGWGVGYILMFDYFAITLSKHVYYLFFYKSHKLLDYGKKCDKKSYKKSFFLLIKEQMTVINELGVRWYPFNSKLEGVFYIANFEREKNIYRHWYVKFIEGILMIVFIVNSFIINNDFENKIYYILSILTIVCFIIQNVMVKFLFDQTNCSRNLYKSCIE
jgi:hypothetical protein